jgi:hypothetical protein
MQNEQLIRKTGPAVEVAILPARKPSPFLLLAQARVHRKLRIALPTVPRRRFCLANRAVRAALSAAEQAVWQASGGDFLRSVRPT